MTQSPSIGIRSAEIFRDSCGQLRFRLIDQRGVATFTSRPHFGLLSAAGPAARDAAPGVEILHDFGVLR